MSYDFKQKNVLALYPADDSGFPARFDPLRGYFRTVTLINYAEACHRDGIGRTGDRILSLVASEKIDVVLVCPFASDYQLPIEFFAELRRRAKVVFWFADDPLYFESYDRYYAQAADLVITSDHLSVPAYNRLEIPAIVYQEMTPGNKCARVDAAKDIDVCFIGDVRKRGRLEYIEFLRGAGIQVTTFGQGSENGYLPPEKLSEYFCRSRINLNFSQTGALDWKNDDEPLLNRVRQNTGRPREVAATGAFCLSEYSPALDRMFRIGEETDCFRDRAELLEKVRFYLANPEKREALAAAAHARAGRDYKEEIFFGRMMADLAANLPAGPAPDYPIYRSANFNKREINSRTFSMFVMLKKLRLAAALETFFLLFRHGPAAFLAGFPRGLARAAANALSKLA